MTLKQIRDYFDDLKSKGYVLTNRGFEHPDHPKPIFIDYENILFNKIEDSPTKKRIEEIVKNMPKVTLIEARRQIQK